MFCFLFCSGSGSDLPRIFMKGVWFIMYVCSMEVCFLPFSFLCLGQNKLSSVLLCYIPGC